MEIGFSSSMGTDFGLSIETAFSSVYRDSPFSSSMIPPSDPKETAFSSSVETIFSYSIGVAFSLSMETALRSAIKTGVSLFI